MPKLSTRLTTKLDTTLRLYTTLSAQIKELEDQKRRLGEDLLRVVDDAGGRMETETYRAVAVDGKSQDRLSREILVKLGVKASIITKATVPGSTYRYPRITDKTAPKKKDMHEGRE